MDLRKMSTGWTKWRLFPDPRNREILIAPFGPGCYELRNGRQLVLYGKSRNVAYRMTSLLPKNWGRSGRNNQEKLRYVFANLGRIKYRTLACATQSEAEAEERKLQSQRTT